VSGEAPQKSCIVLGARGFIGSAIVRVAGQQGFTVIPVEYDSYEGCIGASADILINANGNSKKYLATQEPETDFDLSVRSVSRSLTDFSFGVYVHLSSMEVYADRGDSARNTETTPIDPTRLTPYGLHKYMAELLVQQRAPQSLVIRMGGFVGRGLRKNSIYDLLTGGNLFVHPDSSYQYIETDDLADIVFRLLADGHRGTFNLTGDGNESLRDVAKQIPSCNLDSVNTHKQPEHCCLNIDKIKGLYDIPATGDTVERFIRRVQSGEVALA